MENDFENQIFLSENEFPFDSGFVLSETPEEDQIHIKTEFQDNDIPDTIEEPVLSEDTTHALPEAVTEDMPHETPIESMEVTEPVVEEPPAVAESEFTVEAIVGKRRRLGRAEYCVKWLGFESTDNTWEPIDNLNCQELIEEFESKETPKRGKRATPKTTPKATKTSAKGDGFSRGLKPKRVIGVTEEAGQLFYSMEWMGEKEVSLVPSRVARTKCPQLVIAFLQSKLTFNRKRPREPLENYRPIASKAFSLFSGARN